VRFLLPILLLAIVPARALGYSQFIGFGYTSCLTCHYNANGNGPLNDYGRALFASEIADRLLGPDNDDELVARSGFLGKNSLPEWWRPNVAYRGLNLYRSITRESSETRFIHMRVDTTQVFRLDESERFVAVVNFGYAPKPRNTGNIPQAQKSWISREHYLRFRATEPLHLYVGLADKVYGLRVPDHEAFARRYTFNAQNDQVHGVIAHYTALPFEASAQAFLGNLQQDSDARQKGGALLVEYELAEKARVGLTAQYVTNDYVKLFSGAALARLGLGHGSAVLAELGTNRMTPTGMRSRTGLYFFLQPHMRIRRGLSVFATTEYYAPELTASRSRFMRFGPGVMYFPFQRVELRAEAWNERSFDPETVRREDWSLLGQVSIWL
jgi:hypothetical protein